MLAVGSLARSSGCVSAPRNVEPRVHDMLSHEVPRSTPTWVHSDASLASDDDLEGFLSRIGGEMTQHEDLMRRLGYVPSKFRSLTVSEISEMEKNLRANGVPTTHINQILRAVNGVPTKTRRPSYSRPSQVDTVPQEAAVLDRGVSTSPSKSCLLRLFTAFREFTAFRPHSPHGSNGSKGRSTRSSNKA